MTSGDTMRRTVVQCAVTTLDGGRDRIPPGQNPPGQNPPFRRPNKLAKMYLFLVLKVVVLDYNCDGL